MDATVVSRAALQQAYSPCDSLRIAVVTETYPPEVNGVAMTIGRMVAAMAQRGHRIQLVRPRQEADTHAAEANAGVEHVLTPGLPIPGYADLRMGLPVKSLLLKRWRELHPDVVHLVTEGPLGWSALAAARKLNLPVTSDFHTNFHSYSRHYGFGWLKAPIERYLRAFHNRTRLTMVPTRGMRDELARAGYRDLEVVARGVDTGLFDPGRRSEELRASWGATPRDPVVLYVGRLAPEKNLPLALRAFDALRAHHRGAKLVLVGDGPLRAKLERDHPDAHFAGMRRGADLAAHYASGDVFLFPSLTETFGNVLLEAMASGLAVLAYDYAAAHDLVRHGDNGLLAPYHAGELFCAQAERLADPVRITELGQAARRTALRHGWETIFDQFEASLRAAIVGRERSAHVADIAFGSRST